MVELLSQHPVGVCSAMPVLALYAVRAVRAMCVGCVVRTVRVVRPSRVYMRRMCIDSHAHIHSTCPYSGRHTCDVFVFVALWREHQQRLR